MSAPKPNGGYSPCTFLRHRDAVAEEVVRRQFAANPGLKSKYGDAGQAKCRQDASYHLVYLAEAVAADSPELFRNYAAWLVALLEGLGIPRNDLGVQLELLAQVLAEQSADRDTAAGVGLLKSTAANLGSMAMAPLSHFHPDDAELSLAPSVLDALLTGRRAEAVESVDAAVARGMSIQQLYLRVFQPLLREVGRLWQMNKISVAQEHYCTAAVQLMMGRLSEYIFASERNGYTVVAACVGDELHEVGLRMVADLLEAAGWNSHFLGANVPPKDLLRTLKATGADVLCLSATLTNHLARTHDVIRQIRQEPELQGLKIVVGGYPFNTQTDLWKRFDADGHAADGGSAVDVCSRLARVE